MSPARKSSLSDEAPRGRYSLLLLGSPTGLVANLLIYGQTHWSGEEPENSPQWPVRRPSRPKAHPHRPFPTVSLQPIEISEPETSSLTLCICQGKRLQFECSG